MKKDELPPPGGIVLVVVPTFSDTVIQEMMIRHSEFVWLDWQDLGQSIPNTTLLALPQGYTAVVYSGMFRPSRRDYVCKLLECSGASAVWFERKLERALAAACRIYYGTTDGHLLLKAKPSAKGRQEPKLPEPVEDKILLAGFAPEDFTGLGNGAGYLRWWTMEQAEQLEVTREIREHKVRFIIFNQALSEFHCARHKEAARRYFSSESTVEASGNGQVQDLLLELLSQKEGDEMDLEGTITIKAAKEVETENAELRRKYQIAVQEKAELQREISTLKAKVIGLEQLVEELDGKQKRSKKT